MGMSEFPSRYALSLLALILTRPPRVEVYKFCPFSSSPGVGRAEPSQPVVLADTVYYARNIYEMAPPAASGPARPSSCSPAAKSKLRSPLGMDGWRGRRRRSRSERRRRF